jgi:hypothetical protein
MALLAVGISLSILRWRTLQSRDRADRLAPYSVPHESYHHFPGRGGVERSFVIPGVVDRLSEDVVELLLGEFPCAITRRTPGEIRFVRRGPSLLNQPARGAFSEGHFHLAKQERGRVLLTYELNLGYLHFLYLLLFGGIAALALAGWILTWYAMGVPSLPASAVMLGVLAWSSVWAVWGYRAHKMAVCHAFDGIVLTLLRMEE